MKNKMELIKELVYKGLRKLGEEDDISELKNINETTNIRKSLDSMAVVALSVDLEEMYEEQFGVNIKVLNEEDSNFMSNFETVGTLVSYIDNL